MENRSTHDLEATLRKLGADLALRRRRAGWATCTGPQSHARLMTLQAANLPYLRLEEEHLLLLTVLRKPEIRRDNSFRTPSFSRPAHAR